MRVNELMSHGVECARPLDSIARTAEQMRDLNVGALPVCGPNDRLVGMITDRDITVRGTAGACDPSRALVQDIMTPDIVFCYEDDHITVAVRLMQENQVRRLVVLSRDQRLVGIVSLGDLAVRSGDGKLSAEVLEQVSEPVPLTR